jgi:hypothetical protein
LVSEGFSRENYFEEKCENVFNCEHSFLLRISDMWERFVERMVILFADNCYSDNVRE